MNLHWFSPEIAQAHGIEAAIVFQAIGYWVKHNRNKPDRVKDGEAWFYMARKDWLEEYRYMGEGSIRGAISKLESAGLIKRGNFSEGMYARTTWYTLTEAGKELWLNQPNPLAKSAKPFGENSQTITDNNYTDSNSTVYPLTPKTETKGKTNATRGQRLEQYLEQSDQLHPEWEEWASGQLGWGRQKCWDVWAQFLDYWRACPGAKGVKADWPATWRNWCRREAERSNGRGGQRLTAAQRRTLGALEDAAIFNELFPSDAGKPAGNREEDTGGGVSGDLLHRGG